VDLDGTLLKTDTLLEGILLLLRRGLLHGLQLFAWLFRGRAGLKLEVARRVSLDVSRLPVNEEFLAWLRSERARGRRLVLCTAAPESFAQAVASHFGLFDEVLSSDGRHNLSGRNKGERLAAQFGAGQFDYAGNALRDLPVWKHARAAIVVTPTLPLTVQMRRVPRVEQTFSRSDGGVRIWLRALRVHQWAKNVLVFVPALAAQMLWQPQVLWQCVLAFAAFCLAASGTYIVNDLLDLDSDRRHPSKRTRPLASGRLQITEGVAAAAALIGTSLLLGYQLLGGLFLAAQCAYIFITLWYSLDLKRRAGADILCLAGLYTLRILAGSAATHIPPSFWLLAFSMFLFLSLAAAKRSTELAGLETRNEDQAPGRGYRVTDLPLLLAFGVAAAYSSVLVLALYLFSRAEVQYSHPQVLWLLCPVFLYWVSRVWLKTHRRQLHEDPVVFALTDWPSRLVAVAFVAIAWLAT
jgi:4-hydroxybenzoate polyprenyltransferase/phosphoserine phosphatase